MTRRRIANGALLALGIVLLHGILVMPSHPAGLTVARWLQPAWELPIILLVLVLLPFALLRGLVVLGAVALVVLRAADLGTYTAFSRSFNPLLDLHLLTSGWSLLASSIGHGQALAGVAVVLLAVLALAVLLWAGLSRLPRVGWPVRLSAVGVTLLACVAAAVSPGWTPMWITPIVTAQIGRMSDGVAELADFTGALTETPLPAPRFAALGDRDVIVAFVESYGRSFIEDPDFAVTALPRLDAVMEELDTAGWGVRSGWLAAPTRGGQSWLSHGTLLSGLWVDSQIRYDRLMTSRRVSLNRLFGAAGWRTGAAMPAITLDWPEAAWYGYDITLDAAGLDYAGQPFEWVTMPDQYTWSAVDAKLRGPGPDMIEVALITSHAPWTPLPDIVPWDAVGDGSIFDGTRRQGDTPRIVWSNPDTIRSQYAKSLDYALQIMGEYVARSGDGALFVVLGDHQPAPLLTGQGASPDVPVHIISDDPAVLARLPADLFVPGMRPDPAGPVMPMQDMRALLTSVFEETD